MRFGKVYIEGQEFELPGMTSTERDTLVPGGPLLIFNTDSGKVELFNGSSWEVLGASGTGGEGSSGTQGATGRPGAQGATGLQGNTGASGAAGAQGSTGLRGFTGTPGAAGAQGATGLQGNTGAEGADGAQGSTGLRGLTGTPGAAGAQGQTGQPGVTGLRGLTGLEGPQGSTGPQGVTGLTFSSSYNLEFTSASLSAGVLTLQHNLGMQYVHVDVYDEVNRKVIPDEVTAVDANMAEVSLAGFLQGFTGTWKASALAAGGTNEQGATGSQDSAKKAPTYVGSEPPAAAGPYLWVQTGLGADGGGFTFWIEDGT